MSIKPVNRSEIDDLARVLATYDEGEGISWAITVDGHPYWWVLEYGSGSRFQSGGYFNLQADEGAIEGDLIPPTTPFPHRDADAPQRSRPVGRSYAIQPKKTRRQAWTAAHGQRRGPFLKFRWWRGGSKNWIIFASKVLHPGVWPRGFVRKAIAEFDRMLAKELEKAGRKDFLPDRDDMIEVVNQRLAMLLYHLQRSIPLGSGASGGHLKSAWGAIPAR